MRKRIAAWLLAMLLGVLVSGCLVQYPADEEFATATQTQQITQEETAVTSTSAPAETAADTTAAATAIPADTTEDVSEPPSVEKDGSYTSPEDVAAYIHTFGTLPANFITKSEAQKLGWVSAEGNLWDVAPGRSIGGDRFGNYEELLPEGSYRECDVNYSGGFRGSERLIYGEDGSVYYTNDHYKSFTQLY